MLDRSALDNRGILAANMHLVGRAGRIASASVGEEFHEENGPGLRMPGFSPHASARVALS